MRMSEKPEATEPAEAAPSDDADKKDVGHSVKRKNIYDYSGDLFDYFFISWIFSFICFASLR